MKKLEEIEEGEDYADETEEENKSGLKPYKVNGNNIHFKVPSSKDKSVIKLNIKDLIKDHLISS